MESGNHPNARKSLTNGNATDRVRNSRETNYSVKVEVEAPLEKQKPFCVCV